MTGETDATIGDAGLTCDEVRELAGAFVLGALDVNDAASVRAHLAACLAVHEEIAELASVLPVLDASVSMVDPPDALKTRIMAAAAADLERRGATTPEVTPTIAAMSPSTLVAERPTAIGRPRTPGSVAWVMRIAAVVAIAVLGGWNLLLQGQLSVARDYEARVAAVLQVAAQPGSLTAVLVSQGGEEAAGVAAVGADGSVTLAMQGLAPTTGDQEYTAWVIGGDGAPTPVGGFTVGNDGTAFFESDGLPTDAGIVLALTLEPGPGATTPTLPIVSLGTATAAG